MQLSLDTFKNQFESFPGTRYMGSKNKIINHIWQHLDKIEFDSVLDAFGGSNVLGYFFKCKGKKVISNDFMSFSYFNAKAIIENSNEFIDNEDLCLLLKTNENNGFIENTFRDIFYSLEENQFLDRVRQNISELKNEYKESLALSALVRA